MTIEERPLEEIEAELQDDRTVVITDGEHVLPKGAYAVVFTEENGWQLIMRKQEPMAVVPTEGIAIIAMWKKLVTDQEFRDSLIDDFDASFQTYMEERTGGPAKGSA